MTDRPCILLIEDNPGDARLIRELLKEADNAFDIELAQSLTEGVACLARKNRAIDIVLLDLSLPESQGFDTFLAAKKLITELPIIVLTGHRDETMALRAVREGAQDYLFKGQVDGFQISRSIKYALERRWTEEALRKSEATLNSVLSASPVGIALSDSDQRIYWMNESMTAIIGYNALEMGQKGMRILYLTDEEYMRVSEVTGRGAESSQCVGRTDTQWVAKNGEVRDIILNIGLLDSNNISGGMVLTAVDITTHKQAEAQLKLDEIRLESLLKISQYRTETIQELLDFALNEAITLTESKIACIFFYDDLKQEFTLRTRIGDLMKEDAIAHPIEVLDLDKTGVWENTVNEKKPIILNDYQAYNPLFKDHSEGRTKLHRLLTIPVFVDETVIAVVGVADKDKDYDHFDVRQLTLLMDTAWKYVEQKRIEERIKNASKEWRTTFDSIKDLIMILDLDFRITRLNKATAAFFGMDVKEVLGKHCHSLMHGDGNPPETCPFIQTIFTKEHTEIETYDEERKMWFLASTDPVFDEKGNVISVVHIIKDVTEHKFAHESILKSEEKYRNIFERAVEGIFQSLPNGELISVNSSLAHMAGFDSPDKMMATANNKSYKVFIDKQERLQYQEALRTKGSVEAYEARAQKRDGTIIWTSINAQAIKNAEGETIRIEGTIEDISARKSVEIALRESETRYKNLYDNALVAILLIQNERLVDCNSKTLEMFQCARQEFIGKTLHEVFLPSDKKQRNQLHKKLVQKLNLTLGGQPQFFELNLQRADGTCFDAELTFKPISLRDEPLVFSVIRDITSQKQAEEMVREVLSELESKNKEIEIAYTELKESQQKIVQQEKMASIGQLAAGVAHEINNPMGFIISNLNSLGKYVGRLSEFIEIQSGTINQLAENCEEAMKQMTEQIGENRKSLKIDYLLEDSASLITESLDGADRVKRIVQDLKSFSRRDQPELAPADINKVLDSVLNIVWNELKYKATVVKEYGEVPLTMCNQGQLSQVFMNILVNGAQSITDFGQITIKTWHASPYLHVSITDTGSGIPQELLEKIFEPFFTTKEVGKGTGLGLGIAYDIIKKHKGDIGVTSEVGKGTTFAVKLLADGG